MILKQALFGVDGEHLLKNVSHRSTNGMKILTVNSIKFRNMDRLNHQVRLAMIRYGAKTGHYEVREMYEINGTVKLILK